MADTSQLLLHVGQQAWAARRADRGSVPPVGTLSDLAAQPRSRTAGIGKNRGMLGRPSQGPRRGRLLRLSRHLLDTAPGGLRVTPLPLPYPRMRHTLTIWMNVTASSARRRRRALAALDLGGIYDRS